METVTVSTEEEVLHSTKTNIFIAAFTTCYARLKLYSYLDTLKQQVLYYDTDSVIYKWAPGLPEIPIGSFLGEMTDELGGDVIVEFASGGAKNYGYCTRGGKLECKVRGFTLNVMGSQVLNFESLRDNILREVREPLEERRTLDLTVPNYFERDNVGKRIKLTERVKKYGLVFDKRVLGRDFCSFPYGYDSIRDDMDILLELL